MKHNIPLRNNCNRMATTRTRTISLFSASRHSKQHQVQHVHGTWRKIELEKCTEQEKFQTFLHLHDAHYSNIIPLNKELMMNWIWSVIQIVEISAAHKPLERRVFRKPFNSSNLWYHSLPHVGFQVQHMHVSQMMVSIKASMHIHTVVQHSCNMISSSCWSITCGTEGFLWNDEIHWPNSVRTGLTYVGQCQNMSTSIGTAVQSRQVNMDILPLSHSKWNTSLASDMNTLRLWFWLEM